MRKECYLGDDIMWWRSGLGLPPSNARYSVHGIYGTIEDVEPKEIDRCKLTLFYEGSRDGMVDKLMKTESRIQI